MPRTVLITGCSSGLGRSAALFFASKGWNVVATMRRLELISDFSALLNVLVTRLDVVDQASIRSAIDFGIARFGAIDVLINHAGDGLFGVMDTIRGILPHFRSRKAGLIVNISSEAQGFSEALSYELASQGVRVKIVDERTGTEEQVSQRIYTAVTDGSDRLRYLAAWTRSHCGAT